MALLSVLETQGFIFTLLYVSKVYYQAMLTWSFPGLPCPTQGSQDYSLLQNHKVHEV